MTETAAIAEQVESYFRGCLDMRMRQVTRRYDDAEDQHEVQVYRRSKNPKLNGGLLFAVTIDNTGKIKVSYRSAKTSFTDDIATDALLCSR